MANIALELLFRRDGGRYQYCGREVIMYGHPLDYQNMGGFARQASIDHIIPQSKDQIATAYNIRLACRSCNSRKNISTVEEFRHRYTYDLLGIPRFNEEQRGWLEEQGFEFPANAKFYFEVTPNDPGI